ncbi:MAG TPA: hypothetical protein VIL72_04020 [Beijerinckiaceae bacterium]|jgi:hypothetical protein
MNMLAKSQAPCGLEPSVVSALALLFVAGQRAQDGHMPHFLTANGVKVAIQPGSEQVTVSFQQSSFQLSPAEAYELATMMTAAADGLRMLIAESKPYALPQVRTKAPVAADLLAAQ